MIRLIEPDSSRYDAWATVLTEFDHTLMAGSGYVADIPEPTRDEFDRYMASRRDQANYSVPPPSERVHATFFWIVDESFDDGGPILGFLSLRHALTDFLLNEGGHIGYSVRPSARRRGVAKAALAAAVEIARSDYAISPVLITCDDDNVGSYKTIEACGGVLEDVRNDKRRYWIGDGPRPTEPNAWRIDVVSDPSEALRRLRPLIDTDPVKYSTIASVTSSLITEPDRYDAHLWYFMRPEGENKPNLAAMHTPPQPVVLPVFAPSSASALARHLASTQHFVNGVRGNEQAVAEFVGTYESLTEARVKDEDLQGLYVIHNLSRLPFAVAGHVRSATVEDLDVVSSWVRAFNDEINQPVSDDQACATAQRHIGAGRLSLWCTAAGVPVAMCWSSAPASGVVRISGVYTPPEARGHGYASAVVDAATSQAQSDGYTCTLFTDMANPTSNKIYQALGYEHIENQRTAMFA